MRTDSHESFCVLGLHSEMSTPTQFTAPFISSGAASASAVKRQGPTPAIRDSKEKKVAPVPSFSSSSATLSPTLQQRATIRVAESASASAHSPAPDTEAVRANQFVSNAARERAVDPAPSNQPASILAKRPADTLPTDPEPKLKQRQIVQNVVRAAWNTKTKEIE